jgi:NIMA (never in mitosis gene a)-related kinase
MENYSVLKSIGKGSYGEVFLVSHKSDKKQYVVKTIELASASDKERTAAEQEVDMPINCDLCNAYRATAINLSIRSCH